MQVYSIFLSQIDDCSIICEIKTASYVIQVVSSKNCIKPNYLADILIFDGEPETHVAQLGDADRFRHIIKDGQLVDKAVFMDPRTKQKARTMQEGHPRTESQRS